jgi:hypothetical protein
VSGYIAGLRRSVSKHQPRAYCKDCTWTVTQGRGLSVERVAALAREHARKMAHRSRLIVQHVTQYVPDTPELANARERLEQATAERTGRTG